MRFIARHDGNEIPVEVEKDAKGYRVKLGDRWIVADLVNAGPYVRSLRLADGTQFTLVHHREGNTYQIGLGAWSYSIDVVDPLALTRTRREDDTGGHGLIKALMPGRIVRVLVNKGDAVPKGAGLLVLEAMKMENEIQSPADGVVEEVFVTPGQTVESGAELVRVGSP